ncbi:uncharacterized protein LOC122670087 [Telopea speciosissima]|uniref:uncharacterized protein LOC122670087 n=1 Tax=Telopea speciosissima TaxID=54955 RepID=UPI001CC7F188|nr:uncharacterized protein LOC122670087 [Telopea speciosissima]
MGTLSLYPVSFSPPLALTHRSFPSPHNHLCNSIFTPKISSPPAIKLTSRNFLNGFFVLQSNRTESGESRFLDEDGVVEDMDGYMNYLSLEYDSVWDTKPSWCQPCTIMLTGASVIALSWVILHSVVLTTVVLSLISAWWYIFLYAYPKAYSDMIAERRKKVTSGIEDTFGVRKSP